MNKSLLKFVAGGLGLIAIAVGVLYLVNYIRYRASPEYRAEQYFKDLERRYREDTYGGNTPEETLQLFIDALKKGDIELASKYFVIEKQGEWYKNLTKISENNLLVEMINDLGMAARYRSSTEDQIFFTAGNEFGEVVLTIDLVRINERWKIRGL